MSEWPLAAGNPNAWAAHTSGGTFPVQAPKGMLGVIVAAAGTVTVTGKDGVQTIVPVVPGENAMHPSTIDAASVDFVIASAI